MKNFIYINAKTGQMVDENYPNSVAYVKMSYVKFCNDAQDKFESIKKDHDEMTKKHEELKMTYAAIDNKYKSERYINDALRKELEEEREAFQKQKRHIILVAVAVILVITSAFLLGSVMASNQHSPQPHPVAVDSVVDTTDIDSTEWNVEEVMRDERYWEWMDSLTDAIYSDMAQAFMPVESKCNPNAHNRKEDAAGVLQIRKIMVRHANQCKPSWMPTFTYEDRWDPEKSILMFKVVMNNELIEPDVLAACDVWNPGCSQAYRGEVMRNYQQLMDVEG